MIRFANDKEGIIAKIFPADVGPVIFDSAIEWLLISLLAFMPFSFGAIQAWSEEVVIVLAAAISICFCLKLVFVKETDIVWSWAYIPVALLILVAILQIIPLPTAVVQIISPNTAAIKKELLSDLPNARQVLSSGLGDARGTQNSKLKTQNFGHFLRLVLAVAAVFVVTSNIYRQPERIKRLLAAIAIIGSTVAILALLQDIFGNGKIYWFVSTGSGQSYSGTFINHNHFGQFMNLSIGAAMGLIMVKLHEVFAGKKITPPIVAEYLSSGQGKVIWLLIVIVILGAASIFVSLTRVGMISMLIAGGFTALMLSFRKSLKAPGWLMVILALAAFICVLYIGFDAVYHRLAPHRPALASHAESAGGRITVAAEQAGVIGLAALLAFGSIVAVDYVRNIRSAYMPIRSAAYGLGFGLMAIMLGNLSDFGQHIPANFMLSAVFCALLIGLNAVKAETAVLGTPYGEEGLKLKISAFSVQSAVKIAEHGRATAR